ncbi:MAG: YeeE/YedE thiosulfate transporter family protein, partial [Castellaniella sp.]
GLVITPGLFWLIGHPQVVPIGSSYPALILAGLLVGVGTRLGSGCTSGHGVCGISRFSPRSLVATAGFMAAGFITVYVIRHLLGM